MAVKLIMRWDIRPERDPEYSDFIVNEFIPKIDTLGLDNIQAWLTVYGSCEQIVVSGNAPSLDKMRSVITTEQFEALKDKLVELVESFEMKVVSATAGFQM